MLTIPIGKLTALYTLGATWPPSLRLLLLPDVELKLDVVRVAEAHEITAVRGVFGILEALDSTSRDTGRLQKCERMLEFLSTLDAEGDVVYPNPILAEAVSFRRTGEKRPEDYGRFADPKTTTIDKPLCREAEPLVEGPGPLEIADSERDVRNSVGRRARHSYLETLNRWSVEGIY